jgi:hypothetical protein
VFGGGTETSTARAIGHLPAGVYHASAVTIGNSIYVLGGEASGTLIGGTGHGLTGASPPAPTATRNL